MSEREKSSVSEVIAEFLREAAVLIVVFVPLEFYRNKPTSPYWIPAVIFFSLVTLMAGITLERKRP